MLLSGVQYSHIATLINTFGLLMLGKCMVRLVHKRWQSKVIDVHSFRGAGCDIGQYLVIANVIDCK
jgi:hypothetical protein